MTGWRDKINNGDPMRRIEDWINSIPLVEGSLVQVLGDYKNNSFIIEQSITIIKLKSITIIKLK